MERDLIAAGLRWRDAGTDALTWRDLWVFIRSAQPGTAMHRALSPGGAGWSQSDYINADLIDATNRLAWYVIATSGRVKRPPKKPKPYPRPGVAPIGRDTKTFKTEPMSIEQMIARLGWEDRPEVKRGR